MNDAIQKQLEARMRWLDEATRNLWPTEHSKLARECAALRRLCAEVVMGIKVKALPPGMWERLKAAAEGKELST